MLMEVPKIELGKKQQIIISETQIFPLLGDMEIKKKRERERDLSNYIMQLYPKYVQLM